MRLCSFTPAGAEVGGAGHNALGAWLWMEAAGRVPDESTVIIEHGYALGRPSRIAVSVSGQRVRAGGSGLVVAEGTLTV
jgi:predicted PhzF superfamily epimerase YddE/YHI9